MIYFTIIAYPKTYFNTIFNKICPHYILRGICTFVHNMPVFCGFFAVFAAIFACFSPCFQSAYLHYMRFYRNGYNPCARFSFRSRRARFLYINHLQTVAKYPTFSPFCAHIYRFDKLIFELARAYFYFGVDFAFSRVYYLIIKSANRRC